VTDATYDNQFYEDISDGSRRSAAVVVPLLLRLFPGVRSVVDFGCGAGAWLAEFSMCGVPQVSGLDFGEGTKDYLFISRERFRVVDLSQEIRGLPRHDLAMSVEVAEHLPDAAARTFVRNLTAAADVVMFSAATPFQGGHSHVNERWPGYWIRLFGEVGFRCHDVLRPLIWNDKRVEWWYRQNVLLFLKSGAQPVPPALDRLASFGGSDMVHPENGLWGRQAAGAPVEAGDGAGWARLSAARDALARRVAGARSRPARKLGRALQNLERTAWRASSLLRGEHKAAFKARWRRHSERRLIATTGFFDGAWYASTYPDVAASGLDPLEHFLLVGVPARHDPGPAFSTHRYLAQNPWLEGRDIIPLVHFLNQHGLR